MIKISWNSVTFDGIKKPYVIMSLLVINWISGLDAQQ